MAQVDLSKVKVTGSAEEARAIGLNVKRVPTCGPERPGIAGCPIYESCIRPEKDLTGFVMWKKDGQAVKPATEGSVREGPGPLNLGLTLWKVTGAMTSKVVNRTCVCWEYMQFKSNWEADNIGGQAIKAGCKVVAIEGEEFYQPGSVEEVQPDGKRVHIVQPQGIKSIIKPYVRPAENRMFAANAFAVAEAERDAARTERANLKDFVHLRPHEPDEPADTPGQGTRRGASSRG